MMFLAFDFLSLFFLFFLLEVISSCAVTIIYNKLICKDMSLEFYSVQSDSTRDFQMGNSNGCYLVSDVMIFHLCMLYLSSHKKFGDARHWDPLSKI